MPEGSACARPSTTSIAETWPTWATSVRTSPTLRHGSRSALVANSPRLGRSRWPRLTSRKAEGAWRLTTRIISSGVTPLAASAATREPALVPT
jgi:hypothetical protein